jgi:hypothetical protein
VQYAHIETGLPQMTAKEAKQVENFRKGRSWTKVLSDEAVLVKVVAMKAEKDVRAKMAHQLSAMGMI